MRSGLDELQQNATEVLGDISAAIKDLRDKLDKFEFDKLNVAILELLNEASGSLKTLHGKLDAIDTVQLNKSLLGVTQGLDEILNAPEVDEALAKLSPMLEEVQKLFGQLNAEVNPIAQDIKDSLKSMQASLDGLSGMVDDRSAFRLQLGSTLEDLSDAAQAMQLLAEYLERNPNAILTGKAKDGK